MKARVIKTGDIIEISEDCSYLYAENYDKSYNLNELEFLDVKEKSMFKNEPDYWEKLTHQAAIAAMQGILANPETIGLGDIDVAVTAIRIANITVSKLKEEEK